MGKKVKLILGITGLIILILIVRSVTSGGEEEVVVKEEFPRVEISSPTKESFAGKIIQNISPSLRKRMMPTDV